MNISKAIRDIIVPELKGIGFSLKQDKNIWIFSRDNAQNQEQIEIDKSDWYKNAIRVQYYTNKKSISYQALQNQDEEQATLTMQDLKNKFANHTEMLAFVEHNNEWLHYEDETSLCNLLQNIVQVTKESALLWFKQNQTKPNSIPLDMILTNDFQQAAYEFFDTNNLKVNDPSCLNHLEELLMQDNSVKSILYATFYLGEVFRINLGGGTWRLENKSTLFLDRVGNLVNIKLQPYQFIEKYVEDKESLYEYFQIWDDLVMHEKA
ncbi:hypothetical protein ACFSR7_16160 [Cohnella sp. GCM10020058]|uniref:hypothetical protein n=1 Tax=Cohnella sp. GCM10020058 TaxID=3317330 RepID=UPI003635169C